MSGCCPGWGVLGEPGDDGVESGDDGVDPPAALPRAALPLLGPVLGAAATAAPLPGDPVPGAVTGGAAAVVVVVVVDGSVVVVGFGPGLVARTCPGGNEGGLLGLDDPKIQASTLPGFGDKVEAPAGL